MDNAIAPVFLLNGAPADADAPALRALAQANYGHYTSLQVRAGAAQRLDLHLGRLAEGNAALFDAPLDAGAVRGWMRQAARALGGDCSMRVTVFARAFDHRQPLREVGVDVLVSATAPLPPPASPALRVQARCFVRPVPQLKHAGIFPLLFHRRQALKAGYDDALFVDGEGAGGRISEGSVWNIGFWDGAGVVWPDAPALRGTTERMLQDGLEALGVAQAVRPVTLGDLAAFEAAFATNANGMQAIASIDEVVFAGAQGLPALLARAAAHAPWEAL